MRKNFTNGMPKKPQWEKPSFERLGTIRDIAGPVGSGFQAGPNRRS
ncbi:hypothetical protein K3162_07965 [Qipengyuania xiapuensis]|uniref:Lasso RiPP family leader peptide-containing protein n=1 Tax=Qipengyuania xiapuensis TaxID=2867236 RepID=A0ABX8ZRF0_9SPHN|nr:hypothetical protein [Qipengyuania xiapuensis]QZD91509.1 hypothetical protein K3162_07965 [Qipengyuania xiapuensis]